MQRDIKNYDFVDCLLVDFGVDKLISTLFIIVEAYYPLASEGMRKKGLLKIIFNGISKILVVKNEEFDFDISLYYDEGGDDTKANEIYTIDIVGLDNTKSQVIIDSDMLKLDIEFNTMTIVEMK